MIYIFPIGGKGKRTQTIGKWKPFIKIQDKYIFEHTLDDLSFTENDSIIFITAKEVIPDWGVVELKRKLSTLNIKQYEIIILDEVQPGPALTVYNGLKQSKIEFKENIHIINIDQIIKYDSFELTECSGIMPLWFNSTGKSCYVTINKDKPTINHIKEKELISYYASSGVYIFNSLETLNKSIEWGINNSNIWVKSKDYDYTELFIGPCMTYLIINNYDVWATTTYKKIDLGSSEQIINFKK